MRKVACVWWVLVGLAGCRSTTEPESAEMIRPVAESSPVGEQSQPETLGDGLETLSNGGRYLVTCWIVPQPPGVNELFELVVEIKEAADPTSRVTDLELIADADMPEHGHGMNTRPEVQSLSNGRFLVQGMMFHMFGFWEIYLDITRHGVTERAQLELTLE